ncbi:MGMT family protein [Gallaecimonas sp. GXIMD1310]|uniref:MGMT family protein n=1 Tax=Gallaecimonas sp. GXIMD1310 TaxID=3131926 RepID=UPI003250E2E3
MPASPTSTNAERLYALVALIPPGQVATYGQLASLLGWHARQVGRLMGQCPAQLPWHRVVNAQGRCSPRSGLEHQEQHQRLLAEGVNMTGSGRVRLAEAQWPGL